MAFDAFLDGRGAEGGMAGSTMPGSRWAVALIEVLPGSDPGRQRGIMARDRLAATVRLDFRALRRTAKSVAAERYPIAQQAQHRVAPS